MMSRNSSAAGSPPAAAAAPGSPASAMCGAGQEGKEGGRRGSAAGLGVVGGRDGTGLDGTGQVRGGAARPEIEPGRRRLRPPPPPDR